MARKRYQTDVTAYVDCTGNRYVVEDAICNAMAYPVDCIEVQVRLSDRGTLYLGREELTGHDQMKAVDCATLLSLVAPHPLISLCLSLVDQRLKAARAEDYAVLEALVRESGLLGRVQIKGIDPRAAAALRHGAPNLPYWISLVPGFGEANFPFFCSSLVHRLHNSGAIGLHTNHRFVTRLLQQHLADNELLLSVQGADRERDMRRLLILPVDNIVTSRVSTLLELRSRITQTCFPSTRALT